MLTRKSHDAPDNARAELREVRDRLEGLVEPRLGEKRREAGRRAPRQFVVFSTPPTSAEVETVNLW